MPRDTDVPDVFDVYTVVVLRLSAAAPEMSEGDLDALQARHVAYRADLVRQGVVVAVAAGRLAYDVMEWWVRAGSLTFPMADHPVGERRSMPGD